MDNNDNYMNDVERMVRAQRSNPIIKGICIKKCKNRDKKGKCGDDCLRFSNFVPEK